MDIQKSQNKDCLLSMDFEIIPDYQNSSINQEKDNTYQNDIIQLLRENKINLEKENSELKVQIQHLQNLLNKAKKGEINLQEKIIQLTTENNILVERDSIIEERLRNILSETTMDLVGKLDENFKQHINTIRERNLHIREGSPFPFIPERHSYPFVTPLLLGVDTVRSANTNTNTNTNNNTN